MTDAWNSAEAGGAAAAKNQAQPIRQDMRSFCLCGAGLNILPLFFLPIAVKADLSVPV
jgi:hypothetical protein